MTDILELIQWLLILWLAYLVSKVAKLGRKMSELMLEQLKTNNEISEATLKYMKANKDR